MTDTGCVTLANDKEAMARGVRLAAAVAPACTARLVRLAAGFALGWGATFAIALGAATDFCGGSKSLRIRFSSHMSRVKYSFPSNTWPKPQAPRALYTHTISTSLSSSSSSLLKDMESTMESSCRDSSLDVEPDDEESKFRFRFRGGVIVCA